MYWKGKRMKVVFSNRAYTGILAETTEKIRTETGGLFLGIYKDDIWYVIETIDPGPESIFEVAYFEYDQEYTQHLINKIANLYSAKLELIGLWHRHPGSLDRFSSTDDETNSEYAERNKYGAISALVNIDPDFRLTMYHVSSPCKYKKIEYGVGDDLIPEEFLKFRTSDQYMDLMKKRSGSKSGKSGKGDKKPDSLAAFFKRILPGLSEYETDESFTDSEMNEQNTLEETLDRLIEDVTFMSDEIGIVMKVAARQRRIVFEQETEDRITRVYFGYDKETDITFLEYDGNYYQYTSGLFKKLYEEASKPVSKIEKMDTQEVVAARSVFRSFFDNWKNGKS